MPRYEKITGLYFPYASFRSAKTLKTAVLYFDKIAVIHPAASFSGQGHSSCALEYESRRYMDDVNLLVKEGFVDLIDPAKVIAKFGNEIMTGVVQDLHDSEFLDLCKPFAKSPWVLSSTKLPDEADKWLRNMLVNVPALARGGSTLSEEFRERRWEFAERDPHLHERMRMIENRRFEERKRGRYDDEYESQLVRGMTFDEYRVVELPFAVGESVMIGHATALAADGGFTPFCDERIHLDVLKGRLRKLRNSNALKAILHEYGYLKNAKVHMLAQDVIAETVPSLEHVPLETILEFREKRTHELESFRVEMRKLIIGIESSPWDNDFPNYIADIVDSKVKPALREVQNEILACKDTFWADALKTVAKVSPLPIVGAVFSGIPAHIALGVGATLGGLTLILEHWAKIRKVKRNGWAFLLDAGQLRSPGPR
jgi:hypothetical protein